MDRRVVGERTAATIRWLFIVVIAALNNIGGAVPGRDHLLVNVFLGVWAIVNVVVTGLLLARHQPGRLFGLALTAVDLLMGAALVYFSNGFQSPFFLALFLSVITSSVRLGFAAGVISAAIVALLYLSVASLSPGRVLEGGFGGEAVGRVFLLAVVGLVTGLMTRELLRERRLAVVAAAEADALRDLAASLATSVGHEDVVGAILERALTIAAASEASLLMVEGGRVRHLATRRTNQAPALPLRGEFAPPETLQRVGSGQPLQPASANELLQGIQLADGGAVLRLRAPAAFGPRQRFVAYALASTIAGALDNAQRLERRNRELEDLRLRAERMAAEDANRSELLGLVSHELRRPLAVLNVYSSMLSEDLAEGAGEPRELLDKMSQSLREMDSLIEQLLVMTRVEVGGLPVATAALDLAAEVDEAVLAVRPLAGPDHAIEVQVLEPGIRVRADTEHLRTILTNLLSNAIKYSPRGGEVRCTVSRLGGNALISIADQGIGIAADDLDLLFKRFSRLPEARRLGAAGSGLGLYLSRELARHLRGDITANSSPGEGSTFTLRLPLA